MLPNVEENSSNSDEDEYMSDDNENTLMPSEEFNPKQYYWLFNPVLNLNRRADFSLDGEISPEDYISMRQVNRSVLTDFFKVHSKKNKKKCSFSGIPRFNGSSSKDIYLRPNTQYYEDLGCTMGVG